MAFLFCGVVIFFRILDGCIQLPNGTIYIGQSLVQLNANGIQFDLSLDKRSNLRVLLDISIVDRTKPRLNLINSSSQCRHLAIGTEYLVDI